MPGGLLLSQAPDGTTWCVRLTSTTRGGTRLLSRFRVPAPHSPGAAVWALLADPGAFVMERRMLLNLRSRAEGATGPTGVAATRTAA